MKITNDFLIKVYKEGYERWSDGSLVIYSFVSGQSEKEIRAEHELYKDDKIVYANKLPKEIKAELINQIEEEKWIVKNVIMSGVLSI